MGIQCGCRHPCQGWRRWQGLEGGEFFVEVGELWPGLLVVATPALQRLLRWPVFHSSCMYIWMDCLRGWCAGGDCTVFCGGLEVRVASNARHLNFGRGCVWLLATSAFASVVDVLVEVLRAVPASVSLYVANCSLC